MKKHENNEYTLSDLRFLARERGYDPDSTLADGEVLADPLFWLILSKFFKWDGDMACLLHGRARKALGRYFCSGMDFRCVNERFIDLWKYKQHLYFTYCQDGLDLEKFFKKLNSI